MSWRDRAEVVKAPTSGGSWRDRAVAVDDAIEPEVMPDGFTPPPDISKLESFLRGGGQGLSFGFGDELTGAVESLFTDKTYEQSRDESRAANDAAREANPWTYGGSEVGGALIPSIIALLGSGGTAAPAVGGGLLKAAAPMATRLAPTTIKGMAAMGALDAAGRSEADLPEGEIGDFLTDVGMGAGLGATLGAGGKLVTKGAGLFRADELADIAQTRGAKALGTPKRMLADPMLNKQAKADAQLMLDNDIIKWNSSFGDMAEDVTKLKGETGKAIGKYLESVDMRGKFFDVNKAVADLNSMRPRATNGKLLTRGAYADINRTIDNAVETVKAHGSKSLDFSTANEVKGVLQDLANWNSNKNATMLDKKVAGTFRQSVDDALESVSNTDANVAKFEGFLGDKKVYGAANRAEDSLWGRVGADNANKTASLTDVVVAGPMLAEQGIGPTTMAVGAKKVAERYGNQAIAQGANKLSKVSANTLEPLIKSNPELFGKFLPALRDAATRGSEELAITHYLLSQSDPEYQALVDQVPQ